MEVKVFQAVLKPVKNYFRSLSRVTIYNLSTTLGRFEIEKMSLIITL